MSYFSLSYAGVTRLTLERCWLSGGRQYTKLRVTGRDDETLADLMFIEDKCQQLPEIHDWDFCPPETPTPLAGSKWRHKESDVTYTVIAIANCRSETQPNKFPVTVIYRNEQHDLFTRPLHLWLPNFELVSNNG